jgi:hypothetical protein
VGGRLHTIKYNDVTFDAGGARFNTQQHRIIKLIKELGLYEKKIDISSDIQYIPINPKYDKNLETIFPTINDFIKYMIKYIKKNNISRNTLLNTTIVKFAELHFETLYPTIKQYITDIYPYYSELAVLNAIEGINLFNNEFANTTQYMILSGGLEQLTQKLYDILKQSPNISIKLNMALDNIKHNYENNTNNHKYIVNFRPIMIYFVLLRYILLRLFHAYNNFKKQKFKFFFINLFHNLFILNHFSLFKMRICLFFMCLFAFKSF